MEDFFTWLSERRPILGADTETTGLSLAKDRLRLVQFGDAMQGWAIPYAEWRGVVRETLQKYSGPIVWQNAKFDAGFLIKEGMPFPWERTHDTLFMLHLVDSMGPKSLKAGSALHVDPKARAGEASLKRAMVKNRWGYESVPIKYAPYWGYAALDPVLTARLAETLWPRVQQFREAYDLEMACERVLTEMELRGIRVDVEYCIQQQAVLGDRLVVLQEKLGDVNPNSPRSIISALAAQGAKLTRVTEGGQLSTDDEVLSALAPQYPVAADVLEARGLRKIVSSYFDNFVDFNNDGFLHPHINQLAARTGRMSVTEPALQTVPKTGLVRDAFWAREDNRLVLCDYDNEELRVAAHFSGDEAMLTAFNDGRNLHMESANRLYGVHCDVTAGEHSSRCPHYKLGKAAMFGKAYGAGISKFSLATGLPPNEGARVFRALDAMYPGLSRAMADVTLKVRDRAGGGKYGWVQLVDGRRLQVPADKPYMGFNYLIQGSCASVLKRALVDLDLAGLGEFLVLPVHDEVLFDVPRDQLDEAVPAIRQAMTRTDFRAPLTVDSKIVDRWGEPYREAA